MPHDNIRDEASYRRLTEVYKIIKGHEDLQSTIFFTTVDMPHNRVMLNDRT